MSQLDSDPPPASVAAVTNALHSLSEQRAFSSEALLAADSEDMRVTRGQALYVLGLDDLCEDCGLTDARLVGWRYLVSIGDDPVALAETATNDSGGHVFALINYGPFVAGTVEALAAAEREQSPARANLRVLHAPALYTQALWLHADSGEDVFLPIAPTPTGLEANRRYEMSELLSGLSARARDLAATMGDGDTRGG